MKKLITLVVMVFCLVGCYVKGYTKVTQPSITDYRWGPVGVVSNQPVASKSSTNGFYKVVLTLSNPLDNDVNLQVNCYPNYIYSDDPTPMYTKTVLVKKRSDKDISTNVMGSIWCDIKVVD